MNSALTFPGFPPAALDFLRELARNNNRLWFEAHKQEYQAAILAPAATFVTLLGERLKRIAPGIAYDPRTNGAGSMMRIHRDTRLSHDKTPYKTLVAFVFWEGPGKKMANPSFGFQFGADGGELMAGQFTFAKESLTAYRQAVLDEQRGGELATIGRRLLAGGYGIGGVEYKRVPSGYAADHPRAEFLRHAGLYASFGNIAPAVLLSPAVVDLCFEHFQAMAPLQQWLVKLQGG